TRNPCYYWDFNSFSRPYLIPHHIPMNLSNCPGIRSYFMNHENNLMVVQKNENNACDAEHGWHPGEIGRPFS
ncbi:hypothetical protein, partial [Alicyclobacillus fastidiosus]